MKHKPKHGRTLCCLTVCLICMLLGQTGCNKSVSEPDPAQIASQALKESEQLIEQLDTELQSRAADSVSDSTLNQTLNQTLNPADLSHPQYCVIAIGPERDREILTMASIEDSVVFVDLNEDGNFEGPEETLELNEKTQIGKTRYWAATIPEIRQGDDVHSDLELKYARAEGSETVQATFCMMIWGVERCSTDAHLVPLTLTSQKDAAPVVHFNGPLTMCNYRHLEKLKRGTETNFYTFVGTVGKGLGTNTPIENSEIPTDAHPVAEFTFPNSDPNKPPIVVTSIIKTRC